MLCFNFQLKVVKFGCSFLLCTINYLDLLIATYTTYALPKMWAFIMTQSYFHGSFQVEGHSNLLTLHGEVVVLILVIRENPFGHKGMHSPNLPYNLPISIFLCCNGCAIVSSLVIHVLKTISLLLQFFKKKERRGWWAWSLSLFSI
jgi:hypothetical protein